MTILQGCFRFLIERRALELRGREHAISQGQGLGGDVAAHTNGRSTFGALQAYGIEPPETRPEGRPPSL